MHAKSKHAKTQRWAWLSVASLLAGCAAPAAQRAAAPAAPVAATMSPAARQHAEEALSPPWQGRRNDDATPRGFEFTVPPVDNLADFHGSPQQARLVLFVGGNYYFAMAPLVAEFEREHPEYAHHIYYETLPPGLLERQMRAGGTVTVGNMTWTIKPDAYLAGLKKVRAMIADGLLVEPAVAYATNDLTIMVPAGNPGHVTGLADLGRPDLPVVMPNPKFEGVARQIKASLAKVGGQALANTVYGTKVQSGMTILTHIHHRQTPLFLMQGLAQAGVTWKSEALFQEQIGHPITHVDIPAAQNTTAIYGGAAARGAAHPQAARAWLRFLQSGPALTILGRYGFKPYQGG